MNYRCVFGFLLASAGCGPAELDDLVPEEPVGSVTEAIQDTVQDRPAVALVNRQVRTTINGLPFTYYELWAFACDASTNYMKKRTRGMFGWEATWKTLSSSGTTKCTGAPTAARIATTGANSSDILAVYWRGVGGNLIEGWYKANGESAVTDLTGRGHVNLRIAGAPVVNDVSSPKWVSVAVKNAADNGVYTVAWYDNAYHVLPVELNGALFTTTASNTLVANYNMFAREYITAQGSGGVHHIFSRPPKGWTGKYTLYDSTIPNDPKGVVTIGGGPQMPTVDFFIGSTSYDCGTDGCALYRDPRNLVRFKLLSSGTTCIRTSPDEWVRASIFSPSTGSSHQSFTSWSGLLVNYDWVSTNHSGILHVGRDQPGGTSVESGITVYYTHAGQYIAGYRNAGSVWLYEHYDRSFTDLGLTPLVEP